MNGGMKKKNKKEKGKKKGRGHTFHHSAASLQPIKHILQHSGCIYTTSESDQE